MKRDTLIYRITTGIIFVLMFASAANFAFNATQRDAFRHLGLPNWFRIELTVAKFAGALCLVLPRVPRVVREFSYAGFAITIVSADVAHLSSGDPTWFILPHATFLAILVVSYVEFEKLARRRSPAAPGLER
ncbi:MAG TPA: DoxX family protein [Minicystis sp.]|nr:DoxX family protein [Minicystis sp.]